MPIWPKIVPDLYQAKLETRMRLKEHLAIYRHAASKLSKTQRAQVLQALDEENRIEALLSCAQSCEAITDLPKDIRQPVQDLFLVAYKLLTEVGLRDDFYRIIYNTIRHKVCPFCGCESFDGPNAPREALDHYLPKSKYPFAAANLRNLVPMGEKCNTRYKGVKDILINEKGARRRSFDPYTTAAVRISLDHARPFLGAVGDWKNWKIDFDMNSEETQTWDEVFSIKERYARDILEPSFNGWLSEFQAFCRIPKILDRKRATKTELAAVIKEYIVYLEAGGLTDRAFLKAATFRMLLNQLNNNNIDVITVMQDLTETT